MAADPEFITLDQIPDIADVAWWQAQQEGVSNGAAGSDTNSWQPIDIGHLDTSRDTKPTISGIIYPGKRHVISGEPETMKSWLLLAIALDQIRNGHHVIYIDFEMGPLETRGRLKHLGASNDEISAGLSYIEPQEAIRPYVSDVKELLAQKQPTLVAIDAMTGALATHGYDPNSGQDVEMFYRNAIEPLRSTGAAVCILDHLAKDKDTRGKFAIGSERKIAVADVHLRVETMRSFGRGRNGLAKITTQKDRPGWLGRPRAALLEMVSHTTTHAVTWKLDLSDGQTEQQDGFRPTGLMERISIYLELRNDPATRGDIKINIKGKTQYVVQALDCLINEGYVGETDGPYHSTTVESLRAFRDEHKASQSLPEEDTNGVASTEDTFPVTNERCVPDAFPDDIPF